MRHVAVSLLLGVFCVSCGIGDALRIAAEGVPALSVSEAVASDHLAMTLTDARVHTSVVGHDTYQHGRYNDNQRFVAMIVAEASPDEPTPMFVGCRSTDDDIAAARARCLKRFRRRPLTVRRADTAIYRQALANLVVQRPVGDVAPRLYEVADDPRGDAIAELVPFPVLAVVAALFLWVLRRRGRATRSSKPTSRKIATR